MNVIARASLVEYFKDQVEGVLAQRGVAYTRERIRKIDDHRTETSGNLNVRGSIETYLGEGEVDEVGPDRGADNEAHFAVEV